MDWNEVRTLCVILARQGSKGLPGKNTRILAGQPLVAWTIRQAQQAHRIDRVVLSTDGDELAHVGRAHKIEVIDRPIELSGDTSTVYAAVRHAVEQVQQPDGSAYDHIVILYGNVPLRPADLVDRAIQKLEQTGADSVQSVCPVGKFHPYWMKKLTGPQADTMEPYEPNDVDRRQDLPPVYQLDGGVIVVRRDMLFQAANAKAHEFLGRHRRAVVTQPGQVVDVDQPTDLTLAQAMVDEPLDPTASPHSVTAGRVIQIRDKTVGTGQRVYVVAELGVNHDGSIDRALELVRHAHEAGADAVKLQLFDPQYLLSTEATLAQYQQHSADDVYAMLDGLQLTIDEMAQVRELAHGLGLAFVVTCFSLELVPAMREMAVDAIKVASPDVVNLPLIESLLALDRPMLISTGACDQEELHAAVVWCANHPVVLLQCVSAYPVPPGQAALGGITALRAMVPHVGYSDHTGNLHTGMMAVACGACVIEKHLTYHRLASGPDHAASLDPCQFHQYVQLIREAQREQSPARKQVLPCEQDVRMVSRQSLCATRDLPAGQVIGRADLTVKRPGTGIPAARLQELIGRSLRRAVKRNHLIHDQDLMATP